MLGVQYNTMLTLSTFYTNLRRSYNTPSSPIMTHPTAHFACAHATYITACCVGTDNSGSSNNSGSVAPSKVIGVGAIALGSGYSNFGRVVVVVLAVGVLIVQSTADGHNQGQVECCSHHTPCPVSPHLQGIPPMVLNGVAEAMERCSTSNTTVGKILCFNILVNMQIEAMNED